MNRRKLRFALVYPLAVCLLAVAHTTEQRMRLGIGVAVLGELLRLWAAGYVGHVKVNWTQRWRGDRKIGSLVTAGPYAYVRHPLYVGTFLIGIGVCLIASNAWVAAAALGVFVAVYRRKMAQEERLMGQELGAPYLAYHAAVPRWLPVRGRYRARHGRWSWQGIIASKEWKTLIWVLVVIMALYLREEFIEEREFFPPDKWVKQAAMLAAGFLLILTDGAIELRTRRRRTLRAV